MLKGIETGANNSQDVSGSLVSGPRILSEIARPHSIVRTLDIQGDAIMINDELTLAYAYHFDRETGRNIKNIHVGRERTQPIIFEKFGDEVIKNSAALAEKKGQFGDLYMGLRDTHPVCYIGERYKLSYLAINRTQFVLRLDSTDPILTIDRIERIDEDQDFSDFLKVLYERKQAKVEFIDPAVGE